ncbi:M15 family metallopeptidase [Microbacterium oryzae]|uniref:M15 family metallopeptidase n=1 Tax=Microbacterium oryzae TaxID=743009 RepID=UPI0025B18F83|nr:M15 family metallopeptidase [Microbacterium oryzae]MDN3309547.1 M15 family metallopeptidase [Microbacterium oryzae]
MTTITRPFARIDGLPVAIGIVENVLAAKAWFRGETGYDLIVYSAIRTYDDQVAIFTARYTRTPNGRRVYDIRTWQGVLWYRISAAGTVAAPGTSNHETGRSLDLRDSGPDAGVASSFSSPRNQLLSQNASRFGLTHTGKNFAEPWHFEDLGISDPFLGQGKPTAIDPSDPGQPISSNGTPAPASTDTTTGDAVASNKGDILVETYLLASGDQHYGKGDVYYTRPGLKKKFTSVEDYNAWRETVKTLRNAGQTTMIIPPTITALKTLADWRVKAILDANGV